MQTSENPPLDEAAVEAARSRAAHSPRDLLPCPVCAASVKGVNFSEHARTKHGLNPEQLVPTDDAGQTGTDRRIRRPFLVAVVIWLACLAALAVPAYDGVAGSSGTEPGNLSFGAAGDLFSRLAQQPFWWLLLAGLAACAVSMVAYSRGVFRARVTVYGDRVVLRHRLGTGTVSVPLPAQVQTGEIYRRRSHGAVDHPTVVETTEGVYLRVAAGRRGITVGCKNNTGLRKHWTGWTTAARRKSWDLMMEPPAFVAFQYALARHGALDARIASAEAPESGLPPTPRSASGTYDGSSAASPHASVAGGGVIQDLTGQEAGPNRRRLLIGGAGVVGLGVVGAVAWQFLPEIKQRLGGPDPFIPDAEQGRVRLETVRSSWMGTDLNLFTAVPAGHGSGSGLPVVVILHGASASVAEFEEYGLGRFLTAAVQAGAPPFVLAGTDDGASGWVPDGDGADPQRMLLDELPRWLARRGFNPDRRAVWGWSRGGLGALRLAEVAPRWARASALFSPAVVEGPEGFDDLRTLVRRPLGIWCGEDDPVVDAVRDLVDALPVEPEVVTFADGGHDRAFWNTHTLDAFSWLAGHL